MTRRRIPRAFWTPIALSIGLVAGLGTHHFFSVFQTTQTPDKEAVSLTQELMAPVLKARSPDQNASQKALEKTALEDRMRAEQKRLVTRAAGKVGDASKLDADFPFRALALPQELFTARFGEKRPSVEDLLATFSKAGFEWSEEPDDLAERSEGPTGAMVNRTAIRPHQGLEQLSLQYSVSAGEEPAFYGLRMTIRAKGRSFDDIVAWVETQTSAEWQLYSDRDEIRTYRSAAGLDLWVAARVLAEQAPPGRAAEVPVFTVAFEPSYH